VRVGRLHLGDVIEIVLELAGAIGEPVVAEDDVVGDELARLHDARLLREHDALAQLDLDAQRVLLPLPALRELAANGVGGQPGVGVEGMRTAVLHALGEVGREQLLVELAGVVILLPVPIMGIPGQCGERWVDRDNFKRAAVLGFVRIRQGRAGTQHERQSDSGGRQCGFPHRFLLFACYAFEPQRDPRMRGSKRSRKASPNMLVA
jgi:hypothetical protein